MEFKCFEIRKSSLGFIAFLQASGLAIYCGLVGLLIWKGNEWFDGSQMSFFGPLLFLILFVTSALISALLTLGYPVFLFWEKKQTTTALKLAAYTTGWLLLFLSLVLFILVAF